MIIIKRRIHGIWEEMHKLDPELLKRFEIAGSMIGKYQFIYSSKKGSISLIELINYGLNEGYYWEIMALKEGLFEDIERYESREKAEDRIFELLEDET